MLFPLLLVPPSDGRLTIWYCVAAAFAAWTSPARAMAAASAAPAITNRFIRVFFMIDLLRATYAPAAARSGHLATSMCERSPVSDANVREGDNPGPRRRREDGGTRSGQCRRGASEDSLGSASPAGRSRVRRSAEGPQRAREPEARADREVPRRGRHRGCR